MNGMYLNSNCNQKNEWNVPELSTRSHSKLLSKTRTEVEEGQLEQPVKHSRPGDQLLHFVQANVLNLFQYFLLGALDHV